MWKRAVNAALVRSTGYRLQPAEASDQRLAAELARTRKKLKRARQDVARARRRPEKAPGQRQRRQKAMPRYVDDASATILRRVEARTMTDHQKLFGLVLATRHVVRHAIPGDFVECGVWRGGSMQAVALTLLQQQAIDRHLHLFDTFEGMPPPSEKDRRGDTPAAEMLAAHDKDHRIWAVADLDDVREAMAEVAYPPDRIHYHRGLVEDTIPEHAPESIALLRLDTDWYASTRHELEHLYDRLSPGGILILDDYGDWEGSRVATEEFLEARKEAVFLAPLGSGRVVVKPAG